MARQSVKPRVKSKSLEIYNSFAGGMNITDDATKMADRETTLLVNMDIMPRGSLHRRKGFRPHTRKMLWGDIKGKLWGGL